MSIKCSARGCPVTSTNFPSVKCFRFPRKYDRKRFDIWKEIAEQTDDRRCVYLCERHFPRTMFVNCFKSKLIRRAIPQWKFGVINQSMLDYSPVEGSRSSAPEITGEDTVFNCCISTCVNKGEDVTLHHFPLLDVEAFEIWKERIGNPIFNTVSNDKIFQYYRVCKNHFNDKCLAHGGKYLAPRSLPTLNLPNFQTSPDAICHLPLNAKDTNLDQKNPARIKNVPHVETKTSKDITDISEKENNPVTEVSVDSSSSIVDHLYSKKPKVQLNVTSTKNSTSQEEINSSNNSRLLVETVEPELICVDHSIDEDHSFQSIGTVQSNNIEKNTNQSISQVSVSMEKYIILLRKYQRLLKEKKCSNNLKDAAHLKLNVASNDITFKDYQALESAISTILTTNQIKVLFGEKEILWDPRELLMGFTISYLSGKTYHFLREKLNYPLPSLATIKQWVSTITKTQCKALMDMIDEIFTYDEIIDDSLYFLNFAADNQSEDLSTETSQFNGTTDYESVCKDLQALERKNKNNTDLVGELQADNKEKSGSPTSVNTEELRQAEFFEMDETHVKRKVPDLIKIIGQKQKLLNANHTDKPSTDLISKSQLTQLRSNRIRIVIPKQAEIEPFSNNVDLLESETTVDMVHDTSVLDTKTKPIHQNIREIEICQSKSSISSFTAPISNATQQLKPKRRRIFIPNPRIKSPVQVEIETLNENISETLELPNNADLLGQTKVSTIELQCQKDDTNISDGKSETIDEIARKIGICQNQTSTDSLIVPISNTRLVQLKPKRRGILIPNPRMKWHT